MTSLNNLFYVITEHVVARPGTGTDGSRHYCVLKDLLSLKTTIQLPPLAVSDSEGHPAPLSLLLNC